MQGLQDARAGDIWDETDESPPPKMKDDFLAPSPLVSSRDVVLLL